MEQVRVGIAEMRVERAPGLLVAYGLGSCIGIALYDPEAYLGGMAHTLLPGRREGGEAFRSSKFVDSAIGAMVAEMESLGASRERLWAKIFGGAAMFRFQREAADDGIGARNARVARETLSSLGIPLLAEDVGGCHGRTIEFDLGTGSILVRSLQQGEAVLAF